MTMVVVGLFALLPASLQALNIKVDQSQTGINGTYKDANGNIIGSYAYPASARSGNWFHLQVRAELTGSTNSADNWGCTSITIPSLKARRDRDHDDARIFTVTRTINNAIQVPAGDDNSIHPVVIQFYSGGKNTSDQCNGTSMGSHTIYIKLTRAQKDVDLAFRSGRNIRGDMKVIGNTAVCIPQKNWLGTPSVGRKNEIGSYQDAARLGGSPEMECLNPQQPRQTGIWKEDDDLLYAYVQDNGKVIGTINQSRTMAKLTLPQKAKIVQAKLYWVGRLANQKRAWNVFPSNAYDPAAKCKSERNDGSLFTACNSGSSDLGFGKASNNPANPTVLKLLDDYIAGVQLKVPGGKYVDVMPENVYYDTDTETVHYAVNVDVTHLINPDRQEGEYYVQGINTKLHGYDYGTYAGWMLYVIYDNADDTTETFKNISIYDGLKHLGARSDDFWKSYTLKGFRTPLAGAVNAKLFYFGGDGGRDATDDCIKFNFANGTEDVHKFECGTGDKVNGYNGYGKAVYIGGRGWDYANAFSASITEGGLPLESKSWKCPGLSCYSGGVQAATDTRGDRGKKPAGSLPDFDYTIGYDLHTYNLDGVLGNNQQETRVIFSTGLGKRDIFAPAFVALSTEIHAPVIGNLVQEANLTSCTNSRNVKGRTMEYALTFTNSGNEAAYKIDLAANLDELGIWKYIDLTQTKFIGIYEVDSAGKESPLSGFTCGVVESGLGVRCKQDDDIVMTIKKKYRMRYSVQFSENDTLNNTIGSYKSSATLEYWNYETKEKVELDAIVKDPYLLPAKDCFIGTCVDPKLSIPVKKVDGDDGYYILKPVQSVYDAKYAKDPFDEPFLAYCKGVNAYNGSGSKNADRDESKLEVWLPLPMSDTEQKGDYSKPNSNFKFGALAPLETRDDRSYYNQKHQRVMFDQGKLKNLAGNAIYGLRINMTDLSLHDSMYDPTSKRFEFANINLLGTSFAIDQASSSEIKCGSSTPLYGLYSQIAKTNTNPVTNCATSRLVFKQHASYIYKALDEKASDLKSKLYESCSQTKSYIPSAKDGLYLINPPDNKRIPFAAHCIMKDTGSGVDQYITTVFMGFDASNTYEPGSILNNTCMNLGLAFFVPTNKGRFDNMHAFLASNKGGAEGWENYVGSVGNWATSNTLARYDGIFILDRNKKNTQLWPYGPFGVFKDKSGTGAGAWDDKEGKGKTLHSPGMHSTNSRESDGDTMGSKGWLTIFNPNTNAGQKITQMMQKMEGLKEKTLDTSWWISDDYCKNTDSDGNIQLEPNGDYDAGTWLGYTYQADGSVLSCNDEQKANYPNVNLPSYTHQNYACVGLDSYFPLNKRPQLGDLAVWEKNGASAANQHIYTKMADGKIELKIGTKPKSPSDTEGDKLTALVCARIVEETPTKSNNFVSISKYKEVIFDDAASMDLAFVPSDYLSGSNNAVRQARIEMRYSKGTTVGGATTYPPCDDETATWEEFTDPAIANPAKTNIYSFDSFSIRPAAFAASVKQTDPFIAGQAYKHKSGKSDPIEITTSKGYTQGVFTSSSTMLRVTGSDRAVSTAKFNQSDLVTTIGFANGVSEINISYDEVGEVILNITDSEWTKTEEKGDCIEGSFDTTVPNPKYPTSDIRSAQVGCLVGVAPDGNLSVAVRFVPDRFIISSAGTDHVFELNNSTSVGGASSGSFTYYANAGEGQSLGVNLDMRAVNAKGKTTKFYNYSVAAPATEGNYSQDMDYAIGFPNGAQAIIDSLGATLWGNPGGWKSDIWTAGEARKTIEINFNRSVTVPIKPLTLSATDINLSVIDKDKRSGSGVGSGSGANFYYGRFYAPKAATAEGVATVNLYTEIYCTSVTLCNMIPTIKASDDRDWQRVEDSVSEANVTVKIGSGSTDTLKFDGIKSGGSAPVPYSGVRPREFPVHLSVPPYLWHHPFGHAYTEVRVPANLGYAETRRDCFTHPCSSVEFMPIQTEQWGGTGDAETDRSFKDDAIKERTPPRISW
ncbi:hypothetical protein AGMMS50229_10130 [Campylobacterota bacterium]|nr:hypothetical protein AGMMS50229_10130 [Campylobacterota bacterium]